MEGIIFALVLIFWVLERIVRFFQWVAREAKSQGGKAIATLPISLPPASPVSMREPLRTFEPASLESNAPPTQTRQRTQSLEQQLSATAPETLPNENQRLQDMLSQSNLPFGSPNDLVRAMIWNEILSPPLSRRSRPSHPHVRHDEKQPPAPASQEPV